MPNVFVTILQCAGSSAARRPRAARLRQARWAASLHKMRHCGSGAFDVRYTAQQRRDLPCYSWIIDRVFIDETWAKTNMVRTHGWGPRGQRLREQAPHGHWQTLTFLAALRARP